MKLLRYRGVFYEYAQLSLKKEMVGRQIERSQHLQPKSVSQTLQMLCDRGLFYLLEV